MKIEENGIELGKSPEMLASAERLSDYIRGASPHRGTE